MEVDYTQMSRTLKELEVGWWNNKGHNVDYRTRTNKGSGFYSKIIFSALNNGAFCQRSDLVSNRFHSGFRSDNALNCPSRFSRDHQIKFTRSLPNQ